MVLLSGGHLKRGLAQGGLFTAAAVITGGLTGAALGGVGALLPETSTQVATVVLVLGCAWAFIWYVRPTSALLPTPKNQLNRRHVEVPLAGAALFGAVLGIGFLTVVSTPLVWTGLAAASLSGSARTGCLYGMAFGLGRSVQLLQQRIYRPSAGGEIAVRITSRAQRYSLAGAAFSACLASLAVYALK
jgi:sulfite exporter TauE/SafE